MLAFVFALWLNLAVQPCAMAVGIEDSDCGRCPPSHEDGMAMLHGKHGKSGDNGDATPEHCISVSTACGDIAVFGVDSRGTQDKLKSKADVVVALPAWPQEPCVAADRRSSTAADPPDRASPPLPIHLLNCVFLD